jgi:hypothetical protein
MEKKIGFKDTDQQAVCVEATRAQEKKKWRKPKLEDVSGKVMAQPYIRFT